MDSFTREIKHFINGKFVGSKSGKTFNNVNLINGQIIAKVHEGGSEEMNHAVTAARVAAQMDAGSIWVNSWSFPDLCTPFGGMKESGIGREGGHHSLEFYTEVKNVCVKL